MMTGPSQGASLMLESIREAILGGELEPGSRLVEAQLAQKWQVTRMAVRTVLAVLETDGLIVRPPNRGARVTAESPEEAVEASEVRAVLESLCAARAAALATEADRQTLRTIAAAMREAVAAGEVVDYFASTGALHRQLVAISRQSTIGDTIASFEFRGLRHQRGTVRLRGRLDRSLAEHLAIIDAVACGDAEAAEARTRTHWLAVGHAVRNIRPAALVN